MILTILTIMLALGSLPALAQDSTPDASPVPIDAGTPVATVPVAEQATPPEGPVASPAASPVAEETGAVDLDVLFIGAHPDDEAGGLAAYGQWNEYHDVQVGVITVTRGEGGGNAVGTEEGPALGLLREDEERRAVSVAGIEHVYNLDEVDFYYTVSAELTADTWGYEETLEKVVRVIRATQPEIIVTMNPAPTPGNHGHHQLAARLAVDGYFKAADEEAYPGQVTDEGLETWRVARIFRSGQTGEAQPGPMCAETRVPADPSQVVFGVWSGTESERNGTAWAQMEQEGRQVYASQGWAAFPDGPTDPDELACDFFTLIHSRTPLDPAGTSTTAPLEGAVIQAENGMPLGTELYIVTDRFHVFPGTTFEATVFSNATDGERTLTAPVGWTVEEAAEPGTFTVTVPDDATPGERVRLTATITAGGSTGMSTETVEVSSAVTGTLEPLQEVAYFRQWVANVGVPSLDSLIFPVFSMGIGQSTEVTINLENNGDAAASGSVELTLPAGFEAEPATAEFADLAAGGTDVVTFVVTNTDSTLATANEGGEEGTYPFSITTSVDGATSTQDAGINLVPVASVPMASTAPDVDGQIAEGEYTGEAIDLSRVWEGQPVDSPADGSGTAYVTYTDQGIFIAVQVTDDTLGTVLPESDAKRHWRTDSVEIAIDPLGTAGNTSATFKVGVFPVTEEGGPVAYRDADAHQGPIAETAPGMEIASTVNEPFDGYVLEVLIPYDALPADLDPANATMNIFIYDSDTQDLTGQARLGWSTWGGVQGDPYRWGKIIFEGPDGATPMASPTASDAAVDEPIMPLEAAQSIHSPQSIRQSASDGVGLGGNVKIPDGEGVTVTGVSVDGDALTLDITLASAGDLYIAYVVDGAVVEEIMDRFDAGDVELTLSAAGEGELLISFMDEQGRVQAIVENVTP
jgi:LmbE family N-acetylglucosaminyl deacetylase